MAWWFLVGKFIGVQNSMVASWLDASQLNTIKQDWTHTKIIGQSNVWFPNPQVCRTSTEIQTSFQGFHLRSEAGCIALLFSFHVRYFDTNIWEFYFYCPFSYSSPAWETMETAFLSVKNFLGGMPPNPPRCLRLWRQDKFHVRCFLNRIHYFTKLLKTLGFEGSIYFSITHVFVVLRSHNTIFVQNFVQTQ